MKLILKLILALSVQYTFGAGTQHGVSFVDAHNENIRYEGRVGFDNANAATLYWAGTSATVRFKGSGVKVVLQDERGNNYYNVIIDGKSSRILRPRRQKEEYVLASGLSDDEHTVELFKRTDGKAGMTLLYGFELVGKSGLLGIPGKKRRIEFYGNSITVGSGINEGDFPGGHENNYLSYAAVTARHFDAAYTCIARSGIGLMVSWFDLIMPEMFTRLNPDDSSSKWDFSRNIPDIVVINLLQNDNALVGMPDDEQFKKRFGSNPPTSERITETYSRFVKSLRKYYPYAYIICTLGSMDAVEPGSPWPGYIQKAVATLDDRKIFTCFFPYKNTPDHPDVKEQQQMADGLIRFIDAHIKW
ncbi:MAG TPA: SGNH/GDSL hydrolase family protein [Agriterribacter sp.]|nr:SGNH/GDSL hydrolase family protein [Agriterribacter sp.]